MVVTSPELSHERVVCEAGTRLSLVLENRQSGSRTETVAVTVNGESRPTARGLEAPRERHQVTVDEDDFEYVSLSLWFDETGSHAVSVNDVSVGEVRVVDGWNQLQYDASKSASPPPRDGPDARPTEAWSSRFSSFSFGMTPIVVNGNVYVNAGHPSYGRISPGTVWGGVIGFDARQGQSWRLHRSPTVVNSPAIAQRTLITGTFSGEIGASPPKTSGAIQGHDLDGDDPWERSLDAGVVAAPTADDDVVFVAAFDGTVHALVPRTGERLWTFECNGPVTAAAATDGETVYLGDNTGTVHGRSRTDASERWRTQVDGSVDAAPTVVDGTVYVPSHDHENRENPAGRLTAINAESGDQEWVRSTDAWMGSSPAVVDGNLFAGVGRSVWSFDADEGAVRWRGPTAGASAFPTDSEPVVVDGTVYVVLGHDEGTLFALDANDGTETWRHRTRATLTTPSVADGTIYVGARTGNAPETVVNQLLALRTDDAPAATETDG